LQTLISTSFMGKAGESLNLGVSVVDKHLYSFSQARSIALQGSWRVKCAHRGFHNEYRCAGETNMIAYRKVGEGFNVLNVAGEDWMTVRDVVQIMLGVEIFDGVYV